MVSLKKISEIIIKLDDYLSLIHQISTTPSEEFLKDMILIGSAKYYLQVSIECCLDIANHVISAEHYRAPKDYADSFKVIEENQIISSELGRKLQQMAKFRNRLVHLYGDIDDAYVYGFITEDVEDIQSYKAVIKKRYL